MESRDIRLYWVISISMNLMSHVMAHVLAGCFEQWWNNCDLLVKGQDSSTKEYKAILSHMCLRTRTIASTDGNIQKIEAKRVTWAASETHQFLRDNHETKGWGEFWEIYEGKRKHSSLKNTNRLCEDSERERLMRWELSYLNAQIEKKRTLMCRTWLLAVALWNHTSFGNTVYILEFIYSFN